MGFKEWATKKRFTASFEGYTLINENIREGLHKWPIAGARASLESGASASRMTATRIGAGAIVLGPLGAILGGMSKKDKTKIYVVVELADGKILSMDAKTKEEGNARKFVNTVNEAGAYFAASQ